MPHSYPSGPQVDAPAPPLGTPAVTHAPTKPYPPDGSTAPPPPTTPPTTGGHQPQDPEPKGFCAECCVNMHCGDKLPWDQTHGTPTQLAVIVCLAGTCPEASQMTARIMSNSGTNAKKCPETPYVPADDVPDCGAYCVCQWAYVAPDASFPHCGSFFNFVTFNCPLLSVDGIPFPKTLQPPCPHAVRPLGIFYADVRVRRGTQIFERPPPCPSTIEPPSSGHAIQQADCSWLCIPDDVPFTPFPCPAGYHSLDGTGNAPCCKDNCTSPHGECDVCHVPPGNCTGNFVGDVSTCYKLTGAGEENPADCADYCPDQDGDGTDAAIRDYRFYMAGCPDVLVDGVLKPAPWLKGCNPLGQMRRDDPPGSFPWEDDWGNFYCHLTNACSPNDYVDVFCLVAMMKLRAEVLAGAVVDEAFLARIPRPCEHKTAKPGCHSCERWESDPLYKRAIHLLVTDGSADIRGAGQPASDGGPGTELARILKWLWLRGWMGCGCQAIQNWMDALGVEGCERAFGQIVARLRKQARATNRLRRWRAVAIAGLTTVVPIGPAALLPLRVRWTDPAEGLVRLAIRRAKRKARAKAATDLRTP